MRINLKNNIVLVLIFLFSLESAAQPLENKFIISTTVEISKEDISSSLKALSFDIDLLLLKPIGTVDYPMYLIDLPTGFDKAEEVKSALQASDFVRHLQLDYKVQTRYQTPNDSLLAFQWNLTHSEYGLNLIAGWQHETGGANINGIKPVIALIDDGYRLDHPDLAALWTNPDEIPNNDIDDDNNGLIDDYNGWNFDLNNNANSLGTHGTGVMGLAAANSNNNHGIASPNWGAELLLLQTNFNLSNVLQNYSYLYNMRKLFNDTGGESGAFITVINNSFGADGLFPEDGPIWCEFFDELGSVGIVTTVAVSNMQSNIDIQGDLPSLCSSEYIVTVGGINQTGQLLSGFSSENVDIVAGSQGILTFDTEDLYKECNGTSYAAPQIASLFSLMYSAHCTYLGEEIFLAPATVSEELIQRLFASISPISGLDNYVKYNGIPDSEALLLDFDSFCLGCHPIHGINYWMESDELHINWSSLSENENVVYHWRSPNMSSNQWVSIPLDNDSSIVLPNLSTCEDVEFYFTSSCNLSPYSTQVFEFNTGNCCTPATTTVNTPNSPSSLSIELSPFNSNYIYTLEYRAIIEEATWEVVLDIESSTVLSNLRPCTEYEFLLTSICPISGDTDELYFTELTGGCDICTIEASYCSSAGTNDYEYIEQVVLNGLENTSGPQIDAYGLFSSFSSTPLNKGESNDLSIVPESEILSTINAIYSVWIDYNQDGDFDDINEMVSSLYSSDENGVNFQFQIPENALKGYTRMRVKLTWWEYSGQDSPPCQDSFFGETEDYCILITENNDLDCPAISQTNIYYDENTYLYEIEAICSEPLIQLLGVYHKKQTATEWNLQFIDSFEFSIPGYGLDDIIEIKFQSYCSNLPGNISDLFSSNFSSTSTSDVESSNFSVYPNPIDDYLYIDNLKTYDELRFRVFDQNGVLKTMPSPIFNANKNRYKINLETLASGAYILEITTPESTVAKKIIKL